MSYNFVYCLFDADSGDRKFFSSDTLAYRYADKKGYTNFTVESIRFIYDLDDDVD